MTFFIHFITYSPPTIKMKRTLFSLAFLLIVSVSMAQTYHQYEVRVSPLHYRVQTFRVQYTATNGKSEIKKFKTGFYVNICSSSVPIVLSDDKYTNRGVLPCDSIPSFISSRDSIRQTTTYIETICYVKNTKINCKLPPTPKK